MLAHNSNMSNFRPHTNKIFFLAIGYDTELKRLRNVFTLHKYLLTLLKGEATNFSTYRNSTVTLLCQLGLLCCSRAALSSQTSISTTLGHVHIWEECKRSIEKLIFSGKFSIYKGPEYRFISLLSIIYLKTEHRENFWCEKKNKEFYFQKHWREGEKEGNREEGKEGARKDSISHELQFVKKTRCLLEKQGSCRFLWLPICILDRDSNHSFWCK